ncbi:aminotransferase class I/II-fold pyridoxal phosphate-dependent enzyme [Roseibacillus ishigakijimensis]|uniref:8-amino-7-oxononanoate synthase n=1 Tax=Roseibacillus ishigakijimensis TaxID=454146 RepID=A0A934VGH8_9BACT|nr:8-amino-7-oxononanoate synthase [Roseibacillus ishigakijimensis]MBK1832878.1 8-amino-7-oxononanoate synthase [Roseibacillus ishigakijimensis]
MRSPADELARLRAAGLLRTLRPAQDSALLNFSSNDYLGLSRHPALQEAAERALRDYGTGATASRLVCGNHPYHRELEEQIASLKGTEAARVFANGYATSLGTLSALLQSGDTVILDKLSHASLIDGARLSGATIRVFPHNNLSRLETLLRQIRAKAPPESRLLVVTESVFSMDGDRCPLREIIALKDRYGALLLLDEAHALGVLGPRGLGLAAQLGLSGAVDLQMGTLGKAAGSAGGYLAASRDFCELLTNKARSFIYSTAPPPAQIAAAQAGLSLLTSPAGDDLRARLRENLRHLRSALALEPPEGEVPIIPLVLGDNEQALARAEALREHGFLVPAIRYPTVPKGTARLRLTLSAAHQQDEIDQLTTLWRKLARGGS